MFLEAAKRGDWRANRGRLALLIVLAATAAVAVFIALSPAKSDLLDRLATMVPQKGDMRVLSAPIPVKTGMVTTGSVSSSLYYTGDVAAMSQVDVLPKASGVIDKLSVDVGSKVKAGDVIAELDSAALRAEVSRARANLAAAEARVTTLRSGPRPEQVGQAAAALDAAMARRDVLTKGATNAQVQAAQSALDTARANLSIATSKLDVIRQGATETQWGDALAGVDQARAQLKAAEAKLNDVRAGPKPSEVLQAQQTVDSARASLIAAQERLAAIQAGVNVNGVGLTQAEANAGAAQTAYDSAVAVLNQVKSRPLPWELQAAQSEYDRAKAAYDAASARVDQMKRGASPEDVRQAEGAVASAQATVASAEATLNQLLAGPSAEEVRLADNAVKQAQEGYNLASNPFTKGDFDAATAGVMQAVAAVDLAESNLSATRVLSPIDGVVIQKYQVPGQPVNATSPIVAILSSGVELLLGVEEGQVGKVAEGQKAEITVAAYPGVVFPAKVAFIAPSGDTKARTFQVRLSPETNDGRLRAGMQAQVRIFTEEKNNVPLVPKGAIVAKGGQRSVFVVTGDSVQSKPVTLGLAGSNGMIEVIEGVSAGNEVVTTGQEDLRSGDRIRRQ